MRSVYELKDVYRKKNVFASGNQVLVRIMLAGHSQYVGACYLSFCSNAIGHV